MLVTVQQEKEKLVTTVLLAMIHARLAMALQQPDVILALRTIIMMGIAVSNAPMHAKLALEARQLTV